MKLSFVVPCYNSEKTVGGVVEEILATVGEREGVSCEIILVNDCSPDGTLRAIKELCARHPEVRGLSLAKNFGQHGAIMAGLTQVNGDVVVCLDDDGQTPAKEVFKLIDKLGEGFDVVFARYASKRHSAFKNFGSRVNAAMAHSLIGKPKELYISSYFACRAFVANEMTRYKNPYPYVTGLLLRTTGNIANVDVTHRARAKGESNYTFKKLLALWFNGFTSFSIKPLRVSTAVGAVTALGGFVYGLFIIVRRLILGTAYPAGAMGWSSLMAALLFIGGMIMLMLGLVGEYVGRVFIGLNNSPQYVIRERINCGDAE